MFFRCKQAKKAFINASKLKKNATKSELFLFDKLTESGIEFKFQKFFYSETKNKVFIADFFIMHKSRGIIIEIDGEYHNNPEQQKYDKYREEWLIKNRNVSIIRFTNQQVFDEFDGIITILKEEIEILKNNSLLFRYKRFDIDELLEKQVINGEKNIYTKNGYLLTSLDQFLYKTKFSDRTSEMKRCKHDYYLVEGSKEKTKYYNHTQSCIKCLHNADQGHSISKKEKQVIKVN